MVAGLGLDRYPELWPDYFGHYRRLVWLAQDRDPALAAAAEQVAARFGLPLTVVETAPSRLERELELLVGGERASRDPGRDAAGWPGQRPPLLERPRYEVFPAGGVEDAVAQWIPAGMTVTVTASPTKGLDATLGLTERLAGLGYHVVPHVSARLVRDGAHLADIVARLTACGVDDVFVPGG